MKTTTKQKLLSVLLLLLGNFIMAQNDCFFQGDDQLWDDQFAQPGVQSASVAALCPTSDGLLAIGAAGTAKFGGEFLGSVVLFDGTSYQQLGGGLYGVSLVTNVRAIVEDAAGNLYVGGLFTGGRNPDGTQVPCRNIIKWNKAQQVWEPIGLGLDGYVLAMALDQDTLYVGGEFTQTEGASSIVLSKVAAYNTVSQTWSDMSGGVGSPFSFISGDVNALVVTNTHEVIVGGGLSQADTLAVNSIARWTPGTGWDNMNGGLPSFQIDVNGMPTGTQNASTVLSLAYDSSTGNTYAGGYFGEYIGSSSIQQTKGLAVWNGTAWTLISGIGLPLTGSAAAVNALYVDETSQELYVGGNFVQHSPTNPGNAPQGNGFMKYDLAAGTWDQLNGGIQPTPSNGGVVRVIAPYLGELFVGGAFSQLTPSGSYANNLVSYNGMSYNNLGDGMNDAGDVEALAVYNDQIIVGGFFGKVDDVELERLAFWNSNTGWSGPAETLFGNNTSNFGAYVYDLEVVGPNLYVGGQFGGVGTTNSTGLLRYNLVSGIWTNWGTGLGGVTTPRTYDFEEFQGEMYVAGFFTEIDGTPITYLGKLTGSGWVSVGTISNRVFTLENDGDSVLYIGGSFTSINGDSDMSGIARFDGTTWSPLGQGITTGQVRDIEIDPVTGDIIVGGSISNCRNADGSLVSVKRLGRWDGSSWSQFGVFTNDATFGTVERMIMADDGTLYIGGGFRTAGGDTVNSLLRWNANYGVAGFGSGLNSTAVSAGTPVNALALTDSFLYVGGDFYRAGSSQSHQFGRYLLDDPAVGTITVDLGPDTTVCGSVTLDAGVSGVSYVWNTGETTPTLDVTASGWYAVTAFNGNCSDEDSVFVTVSAAPVIFMTDSAFACDSIVLDAGPGFLSYEWDTGGQDQTTTINASVLVRVTVEDSSNCLTTDSIFAIITGFTPVADFTFQSSGDTAVAFTYTGMSDVAGYEWEFGDGNSSTGTNPFHKFAGNDTFQVRLIVSNDCGSDTMTKEVVVDFLTSLGDPGPFAEVRFGPNPVSEVLTVSGSVSVPVEGVIELIDLQGRTLINQPMESQGLVLSEELSVEQLPPGFYLLSLTTNQGRLSVKIRVD